MTRFRPLLPLAIAVSLAACGDGPAADDGRAAPGEVLEGTISDAMLPLDTVRSQPPLAEPEAAARVRARAAAEDAPGETPEGDATAVTEGEEGAEAVEVPAIQAEDQD